MLLSEMNWINLIYFREFNSINQTKFVITCLFWRNVSHCDISSMGQSWCPHATLLHFLRVRPNLGWLPPPPPAVFAHSWDFLQPACTACLDFSNAPNDCRCIRKIESCTVWPKGRTWEESLTSAEVWESSVRSPLTDLPVLTSWPKWKWLWNMVTEFFTAHMCRPGRE